jgi:hypothetical protein
MDQPKAMMQINREIQPGETLLWSGLPRQGIFMRGSDAAQIPFSLAWCGFACFWEYTAINSNSPIFFKLWGIPFVIVGLYMVVGRFIADSAIRSNTAYAVTSKRILFISGLFSQKTTSIGLLNIPELSLSEKDNGSGTVSFSPALSQRWSRNSGWPFGNQAPQAFELSDNARQVYNTIIKAQSDAKRLSA